MGYGWIISNLPDLDVMHNGSTQFFPLSTKAETMAILTSLINCPQNCLVHIHTDSQGAIDSFHKPLKLNSLSPQRFNKINNNILWSCIHYIIKQLNLHVKLFKVKAHSGNQFNEIANTQAKLGHLVPIFTEINFTHLPSQTITLMWNETIPIDRNARKSVSTILNFKITSTTHNYKTLKNTQRIQ
jgi:ribonuclease HI